MSSLLECKLCSDQIADNQLDRHLEQWHRITNESVKNNLKAVVYKVLS